MADFSARSLSNQTLTGPGVRDILFTADALNCGPAVDSVYIRTSGAGAQVYIHGLNTLQDGTTVPFTLTPEDGLLAFTAKPRAAREGRITRIEAEALASGVGVTLFPAIA